TVEKGLAVIFVIGEGMGTVKGIFGAIFDALTGASVKAKMVEQGADQQNIMIGVSGGDYETAINALYNALIPQ
ncbi:MAG: aspartate kinase, partial [Synergistaceae bacterium]|nr:aspartate kinase [Synergistaceae bacterium]